MGYNDIILTIEAATVCVLLLMALILCFASRFKGESNYAALSICLTTIPDFLYTVCGVLDMPYTALIIAPVAYASNLALLPFLYVLAHRAFNPYFKLKWSVLLHFLPSMAFCILVAMNIRSMTIDEASVFTVARAAEFSFGLTGINFLIITAQIIIYFYLIFSYLHKVRHYILNTQSAAELSGKVWIPRFITLAGILIITAMAFSFYNPFGGFRIFYLLNVIAMGFLLYSELRISYSIRRHEIPEANVIAEIQSDFEVLEVKPQPDEEVTIDEKNRTDELIRYAREVQEYLTASEAYLNPHLSLNEVAQATGISAKNISRAINTVLDKNFFELINSSRIEKSKCMLAHKKEKGLTLETIAEQCGFNSQVTYCNAFKRTMGMTTSEWVKLQKGS